MDNRAFCKYICPITVFLKPMSYFSLLRVKCDESKCIQCGKCLEVCPMDVEVNKNARNRAISKKTIWFGSMCVTTSHREETAKPGMIMPFPASRRPC